MKGSIAHETTRSGVNLPVVLQYCNDARGKHTTYQYSPGSIYLDLINSRLNDLFRQSGDLRRADAATEMEKLMSTTGVKMIAE